MTCMSDSFDTYDLMRQISGTRRWISLVPVAAMPGAHLCSLYQLGSEL